MPLPLYGSGGRRLRISSATWPTSCLSMPRTIISVGCDSSKSIPTRVADALALLRLRRASLADIRRDLADELLVDATNDDLGRLRHLEIDSLRRLDRDRVGEAERQLEVFPFQRGAVADALDLEALLEAVGDALDHVRDQRAGEPVEGAVLAAIGRPGDEDRALLLGHGHVLGVGLRELAFRPFDDDVARGDRHRHGVGDRYRFSSDSTHLKLVPSSSPDVGDYLAADALLTCFVTGHHTVRGADDRGAGS